MAFLRVEDRYGEIEVIVFTRQYSKFEDEIFPENAVLITGNLSVEDGEGARIILQSLEPLRSNTDMQILKRTEKPKRVYIKVADMSDPAVSKISRIASLNPGEFEIVLFDAKNRKSLAYKGAKINADDRTVARLSAIFGEGNVVVK